MKSVTSMETLKARGAQVLRVVAVLLGVALSSFVLAQTRQPATVAPGLAEGSVSEWLMRVHQASRQRAYVGTFVVMAGGSMSSSRIWHVCDGEQQMERVESLTGPPRSTFRRNDLVMTYLPESRVVVAERRETLGLFPNLLQTSITSLGQFYRVKAIGRDRVAGFETEVVQLRPEDDLRFGYRVWTERASGLVVKLQTLDSRGQVLEQAAFSELQLDAQVSMASLNEMMGNTEGYQVEKPQLVKTTAAAEGWVLKQSVPGFNPMSCYIRPGSVEPGRTTRQDTLQWVFSDGLASVSLFLEVYDPKRHLQPGSRALGATHTLTRRLDGWWLTVVGEVPPHTLVAFAQGLERKK